MGRPEGEALQSRAECAKHPSPESPMRLPDLRERSRPWIPQVDQPMRRAPDSGQPRHQAGGVRRAAAPDNLWLEPPDHRPRAHRCSADPAAALVRKIQERGDLITKLAQQTAKPPATRNARYP